MRRTWTEGERRYFHYRTDAAIGNEYAFFSADYRVHEGHWNDVAIQIFHHPGHDANLDRMIRSIQASLDYGTRQFGPYPYRQIRLVERPGQGGGLHADAINISYQEGFSCFHADDDPRGFDLVFAVVAHEVGHQWWGGQLKYARVEGAIVLSESLAWYSAFGTVKATYGHDHLRQLLSWMREPYPIPPQRATVPLLRANSRYLGYRKGPFAMYALSEYIGEDKVNQALRRLLTKHVASASPLPTSLDLYRELQDVTPNRFKPLLHDLFEANTFWEFKTRRATAKQTAGGSWQVTLDVSARKLEVDSAGIETPLPVDDLVEIGIFAPAQQGNGFGETLHLEKHRIHSAQQTITVNVPRKPARAGIDPYRLLIDWQIDENIQDVQVGS